MTRGRRARANIPRWPFLRRPTALFQWPTIFVGLVAGAAVAGLAAAAPPMFLSSTATMRIQEELSSHNPSSAGLSTSIHLDFPTVQRLIQGLDSAGPPIRTRRLIALQEVRMRQLAEGTDGLASPILSLLGPEVAISAAEGGRAIDFRIVSRSGFQSHLVVTDEARSGELWIPDTAATALGIRAGELLQVQSGESLLRLRVKAVYRSLDSQPLDFFWQPLRKLIVLPPENPGRGLPLLTFADIRTVEGTAEAMRWRMEARWELPLERRDLSLGEASDLAGRLLHLSDSIPRLSYESDYVLFGAARYFEVAGFLYTERLTPTTRTALPGVVRAATGTRDQIALPTQAVALLGLLASLSTLAVMGLYTVQRRRTEYRLLVVRGVHRKLTALAATTESALPVVLGCAIAIGLAYGAIGWWVPGRIDPAAVAEALLAIAVAIAVGISAYAVSVATAAERLVPLPTRRVSLTQAHANIILLGMAALAFVVMSRYRGLTSGGRAPNLSLVLAPLVAMGATAILILGVARVLLARLNERPGSYSIQFYLARRRLARQPLAALVLGSAAAVAVGLLVYTSMLVSTGKATTYAKSHVFVGSDVQVYVSDPRYDEPLLSVPSTTVLRLRGAHFSGRDVDVLGVDPATFAEAAYWDSSFSATQLPELMSHLRGGSDHLLPALAAGSSAGLSRLEVEGSVIQVQVAARPTAFPGMRRGRALVVVPKDRLLTILERRGIHASLQAYVWAKGPTDRVLGELAAKGLAIEFALTARDVAATPTLLSLTWTLSTLKVLGVALGALAIGGLLTYLAARQRTRALAYGLMRRMGLSRRAHRVAIALELGITLMAAVFIGSGAGAFSALLLRHIVDLLPQVPPDVLVRFPYLDSATAAATALAASALGAIWVQRTADQINVAEALRANE